MIKIRQICIIKIKRYMWYFLVWLQNVTLFGNKVITAVMVTLEWDHTGAVWASNPTWLETYKKGKFGERDTHPGRAQCWGQRLGDTFTRQRCIQPQKSGHMGVEPILPRLTRRDRSRRHPDLGLLTPRIERWYISAVQVTQAVVLCDGIPS